MSMSGGFGNRTKHPREPENFVWTEIREKFPERGDSIYHTDLNRISQAVLHISFLVEISLEKNSFTNPF